MKDGDTRFKCTVQAAGVYGWVSHLLREFIETSYKHDSPKDGVTRRRMIVQAALLPSNAPVDAPSLSQVSI